MKTKLRDVTVYAVLLAIIVLWPFLVIGMGRNYVAKLWSENVSNFDLANSLLWFVFVMGVFVWVFRLRQAPRLLRATFTTVFLSGIILAAVFRNDSVAVSDKLFFLLNRTEFDEIVARSADRDQLIVLHRLTSGRFHKTIAFSTSPEVRGDSRARGMIRGYALGQLNARFMPIRACDTYSRPLEAANYFILRTDCGE